MKTKPTEVKLLKTKLKNQTNQFCTLLHFSFWLILRYIKFENRQKSITFKDNQIQSDNQRNIEVKIKRENLLVKKT
jgi:hypothetical protein